MSLTKQDAEKIMAFLSVYVVLNIIDFEALTEVMLHIEDMTSRYEIDRWEPVDQLHRLLENIYRDQGR